MSEGDIYDVRFRVLDPRSAGCDPRNDHDIFHRPTIGKVSDRVPRKWTAWEYVRACLKMDRDTQAAVIPFVVPGLLTFGEQPPEAMFAKFAIREGALSLAVAHRSHTGAGLVDDLLRYASLLEKMAADLQSHYPGLPMGGLTYYSDVIHA